MVPVAVSTAPLDHSHENAIRGDESTRSEEQSTSGQALHARPKDSVSLGTASRLADTNSARAVGARATDVRAAELRATDLRAIKDPAARAPARDLTYGNPVKALVDETIWNMGTGDSGAYRTALREGKSVAEAAQAAGGQLAVVHRKIGDYTRKMETALSESKAIISVREAVDRPLEQAILEIISTDAISEAEKDEAIQQLGTLEAWVKRGLTTQMTPLETSRIIREIGERLNWGASGQGESARVPEELKPAYREIFGSLKSAIYSAVPDARNLLDRLINLYAVKADLENMPMMRELNSVTA